MAGRKTKYEYWLTEEGLILIQGWARDGLTDEDIAHNMGIAKATLCDWKNKFPELSDVIKQSKEVADRIVENALFKRATGYRYKEITKETRYGINGEPLEYTKEVEKEFPPDPASMVIWLKNRKPDTWREKQEAKADTTALEKLDAILAENIRIANETDAEAKRIHPQSE